MQIINCQLTNNAYPIFIGENLLGDENLLAEYINNKRVMLVIDHSLVKQYLTEPITLQPWIKLFNSAKSLNIVNLAIKEEAKQWQTVEQIIQQLIANKHDRDTVIVAFGGGVLGDLVGFVASCYMRGIPWIMLPTTLLAQVDAAVGGKTAINFDGHKNLLGSFYQPQAVVIDVNTLKSLPEREYSSGLAEVIKYGVVCDMDFFSWLEKNYQRLLARESEAIKFIVHKSCELKVSVVVEDELERGRRVILNYGHTIGHALEAATNFNEYLHGEAVAIGMVIEAWLSYQLNNCTQEVYERIVKIIKNVGLPTAMEGATSAELLLHIEKDKKNRQGNWNFVLPTTIGEVVVSDKITREMLIKLL